MLVALAALTVACSDAPNGVTGGEARFDAAPPSLPPTHCAEGTGATWTDLYRDCFGPGRANCGGTAGCHLSSQDTGTSFSGFLCGSSKDECYAGMVGRDRIVDLSRGTDPTLTRLYTVLRKAPPLPSPARAMPNDTGFAFTDADLARIRTWIANGAKND